MLLTAFNHMAVQELFMSLLMAIPAVSHSRENGGALEVTPTVHRVQILGTNSQ